jgi:hypothetical protein
MKLRLVVFLFALTSLAQAPPRKPALAELQVSEGSVAVTGVWQSDIPANNKQKDIDTVSKLTCFDDGGEALVKSKAFCVETTAMWLNGMLNPDLSFLKVIRWDDAEIIAEDNEPICLKSLTIFDLKRKTVIGVNIRKPEAKGLANVCESLPDRETLYLRSVK